jgi:hypothetical protein
VGERGGERLSLAAWTAAWQVSGFKASRARRARGGALGQLESGPDVMLMTIAMMSRISSYENFSASAA